MLDMERRILDNIQYTLNEAAGLNPAMKISFVYEDKQYDDITGYVYGNVIRNDKLLKNILIHNNYTGKKLFDYSLEYFDPECMMVIILSTTDLSRCDLQ